MAGPAGGSGGGHRGGGGFGGGGHRGGGFNGGFGRGPRRPYFGYYRPYGYYGGGIIGGLLGAIMLPIIVVVFAVILLISNIFSTVAIVKNGGQVVYNEVVFQDYANANYYAHFSDATTEEDGVMIIVLTYEDSQELAYVAWIGDNVSTRVNDLFGVDDEFGYLIETNINIDNYKYSLSKDIAKVMDYMTEEVTALGLNSSFVENHNMSGAPKSELINRTELQMNENTVESALDRFTEGTDIPAVVLVDKAENVFGKTMPVGNIVVALLTLVVIGICIYSIIKNVKRNKTMKNDFKVNEPGSGNSTYGYNGVDRDMF